MFDNIWQTRTQACACSLVGFIVCSSIVTWIILSFLAYTQLTFTLPTALTSSEQIPALAHLGHSRRDRATVLKSGDAEEIA